MVFIVCCSALMFHIIVYSTWTINGERVVSSFVPHLMFVSVCTVTWLIYHSFYIHVDLRGSVVHRTFPFSFWDYRDYLSTSVSEDRWPLEWYHWLILCSAISKRLLLYYVLCSRNKTCWTWSTNLKKIINVSSRVENNNIDWRNVLLVKPHRTIWQVRK